MGTREEVWNDAVPACCGSERLAWSALPAPASIRAILRDWAAPGDAAPLLPRERNPAALTACYAALGAGQTASRPALALLHENAMLNSQYGLWAGLRAEARVVLEWLAPLAADGAFDGVLAPGSRPG